VYNSTNQGAGGCGQFSHTVATPYAFPKTGTWLSAFGSYITVNDNTWYSVSSWGASVEHIEAYTSSMLIWQKAPTDAYNPSKWQKIEFHDLANGGWAYCTSIMSASTAAEALSNDTSAVYSATNQGAGGCGQFSHTSVTAYAMPKAGTWLSNYGQYVTVTNNRWYSSSSYGRSATTIEAYGPSWYISQNAADASWNPSKWQKIEFHDLSGGAWAFCTSIMTAVTAAEALSSDTTAVYNSTNQGAGGCGQFSHTTMSSYAFPYIGEWLTNFGSNMSITSTSITTASSWGTTVMRIEALGNTFALIQMPADDAYNPSKYALLEFHAVGNGFGYCTSTYGHTTAAAAFTTDTSAVYNASESGAGGCGQFSHTTASPRA